MLITANAGIKPAVLHRRISLPSCAAVLAGITLGTLYLSGALREEKQAEKVVVALPNPPAPLAETGSPYPADQITGQEGLPLKLEIIATQDAWVEVDTDGHNKYKNFVRGEETLSFEAFQLIRIMTGNAAGLELRFNGRSVAAPGTNRRLRTLEFTTEGILEVNSRNS